MQVTRARVRAPEEPSEGLGFNEPPLTRGRYDWEAIARKCRRQPGRWFQVFSQDKQTYANSLRQGSVTVLRGERGFEVKTANNRTKESPRLCDLFVRYVPERDTTREKDK